MNKNKTQFTQLFAVGDDVKVWTNGVGLNGVVIDHSRHTSGHHYTVAMSSGGNHVLASEHRLTRF